ncbi:Hemerythrin HHE cation binding domain-containing protein [Streptoalloteichus tenebrarius]|uniref:Hemerythrin HHE cation binding domain-containing protein n=1 Tax=Streptoalloteichus tenebrarius (strain ATCC 17920 / DSM 40477 / JCM 4838 / CBS 697.72 / NBRC 16177 / NCIMB 11028 / NRRL B-12390 / A12253. 1 / ISP 5477) TaxID=1933 RepID=A0ABT1HZK0_STRSD|nr:hemerythrin domain-containing protein [Streptoalloteichus tenebrarius]MCP2260953.1 Hemerythrin HHE cation binding domain-containing protein [Streptoalloteichus tenebrarius]
MCEYCGCQAITAIGDLTREHDEVVALISRIRTRLAEDDRDAAAALVRQVNAILGPHTTVEEEGLFPAMAEDFPEHVADLVDDHRTIHAVLAEAEGATPADPDWPDRLLTALDRLREHILAEQDGLFPAALATLNADQWERVDAVRARVGQGWPLVGSGQDHR